MKTPVVELDGDEMTRIWGLNQDRPILPYLDTDLKYYDLGIEYRDKIEDRVTVGASQCHPPERRHDSPSSTTAAVVTRQDSVSRRAPTD